MGLLWLLTATINPHPFKRLPPKGAGPEPGAELLPESLMKMDKCGNSVQLADLRFFEVTHNPDGKTVYGVRDARAACLAQAPYLEQLGEAYSRPKPSPSSPP